MALGGFEWVLIALALLMLFGAKRIPELVRGIGQGIGEFRKTTKSIKSELDREQQQVTESLKYEQDGENETSGGTD